MKKMNNLKLSLIIIATLVASNVNAQTFYSCIPEGCPSGQYFDGRRCLSNASLVCGSDYEEFDPLEGCKKTHCTEEFLSYSSTPLISGYGEKSTVGPMVRKGNAVNYKHTIRIKVGDRVRFVYKELSSNGYDVYDQVAVLSCYK